MFFKLYGFCWKDSFRMQLRYSKLWDLGIENGTYWEKNPVSAPGVINKSIDHTSITANVIISVLLNIFRWFISCSIFRSIF